MKLSAIVITKDAAEKLKGCIESLKFADEIIVVDSGSTDDSVELARKARTKVVEAGEIGFAADRNVGAKAAQGEWLLYIDSDERVSHQLADRIIRGVSLPYGKETPHQISSYKIYRKNIILGKWLRHGGWWPDPVHRLIKKSALKQWRGELHEYPVVSGEADLIKEPIIHYSKNSISEMVQNSRLFAPIEAELKLKDGHPPVKIYHFILAMWREFWRRGIAKAGWLDGWVGVFEVMYQMFHQVMVYSILWEKQRKAK
jgi:glycosyltransferase involved in cell wall biosynthesis